MLKTNSIPQTQKCYAPPISSSESVVVSRGDRFAFWTSRDECVDPIGGAALSISADDGWTMKRLTNVRLVGEIFGRSPGSAPGVIVVEAREIAVQLMKAHVAAVCDFGSSSAAQITQHQFRVFGEHGLPEDVFGGRPYTGAEPEARFMSGIWMDCK